MIAATHKCGCLPKEKQPPCSPCCASAKKVKIKTPLADHSEGPCCKRQCLPSTSSYTNIEEPLMNECCPTEPEDTSISSRKVRSDIAERGLPYKELEAIINNNRVVIRMQKEIPAPEYDPPCDCDENPNAPVQYEAEEKDQSAGNRTVTLISRSRSAESVPEESFSEEEIEVKPIVRLENPNIFLLRVRRISKDGENIDLEFKTPRPWSRQKHLEYCENIRPRRSPAEQCNETLPEDEQGKQNLPRRGKKRKRK